MDQLGLHDQDVIVELMIVQPRCYHIDGPVRTWRASAALMRAVLNQCASAAEEALGPKPRTKTGAHCIDCEAAADCKTLTSWKSLALMEPPARKMVLSWSSLSSAHAATCMAEWPCESRVWTLDRAISSVSTHRRFPD